MRFMLMIKANKQTEAGLPPGADLVETMGKFNKEMLEAGVLLAAEGLQPSAKGARIQFSGGKRSVLDGPFTETKELVAGYWLIQVKSKEEAIEWAKRSPEPMGPGQDAEIEIRQVFCSTSSEPSEPSEPPEPPEVTEVTA